METTREKALERSHEETVESLQHLLEKNYDAEAGYKEAMLKAENTNLKQYLKERAALRNRFATELSDTLIRMDEKPKEEGSATGDLHRTWMNIKQAFSSDKDESILEECIRGEKASVEEYEEVLEKKQFRPEITEMITRQKHEVSQTLGKIKTLEDLH
ncbi:MULTISPECIES: PA2169 family four-helix-bundle protein [unclassified Leeuwenhoekiella]|uniref:ferritin-like domain-containing protein n=1 Tax=unclassified Leeuwenhoekiella TaxID=2615029 RepID=UPI000C421970|nr:MULTISPECIES: PA2169 family four-helix-bundle protein [unclassified Leeuwenhoekiella]MAW95298.1 hypothetical protein [Leeuwenhoekiella sp.]MBA81779.1 hypothetical protein [Leeuwenhoekiella sp.]|tara:strand:+ start:6210 stop:6683 length:474 start_codon:yes stop_codon:yes gene_type:complete